MLSSNRGSGVSLLASRGRSGKKTPRARRRRTNRGRRRPTTTSNPTDDDRVSQTRVLGRSSRQSRRRLGAGRGEKVARCLLVTQQFGWDGAQSTCLLLGDERPRFVCRIRSRCRRGRANRDGIQQLGRPWVGLEPGMEVLQISPGSLSRCLETPVGFVAASARTNRLPRTSRELQCFRLANAARRHPDRAPPTGRGSHFCGTSSGFTGDAWPVPANFAPLSPTEALCLLRAHRGCHVNLAESRAAFASQSPAIRSVSQSSGLSADSCLCDKPRSPRPRLEASANGRRMAWATPQVFLLTGDSLVLRPRRSDVSCSRLPSG
jgi:hypothetical protein